MIIRALAWREIYTTNSALSLFSDGNFIYGEKLPEFSWQYNKFPHGVFIRGNVKKEFLKTWAETIGTELEADEIIWRNIPQEIREVKEKVFSEGLVYFLKMEIASVPKVLGGIETVVKSEYGRKVKL